jgi:hypothetical protein
MPPGSGNGIPPGGDPAWLGANGKGIPPGGPCIFGGGNGMFGGIPPGPGGPPGIPPAMFGGGKGGMLGGIGPAVTYQHRYKGNWISTTYVLLYRPA